VGGGSTSIYYYFSDALGSARVVTTSDGTICYDADFYPFGSARAYTTSCSPSNQFTDYESDSETGLDYAHARYYQPRFGRFMSADPLSGDVGDPQSLKTRPSGLSA
jgi:RHS repeat-associated protein